MKKRQAKNLKAWDMYRSMMASPAAVAWMTANGKDAVITGWGLTYSEIETKVAELDKLI